MPHVSETGQYHERQLPQSEADMVRVAGVRFQSTGRIYSFDASAYEDLRVGEFVLVETVRGQQIGKVVKIQSVPRDSIERDLSPILRRATEHDLALRMQWQEKAQEALQLATTIAAENNLPIKLVDAEYTFDGHLLTILYVADEEQKNPRLDKLAQRLRQALGVKVELRRLGPRDYAKLLGGYGACGEPRCCARFLSEFVPVSIKMAKLQGVSLDPSEITGICGRLRCCLAYEEEQYREACALLPRRKEKVLTPYGEGKVVDLLPLQQKVVVLIEDRRVELPVEQVTRLSQS